MRSRSSSSQAPHPQSAAAASVAFSPLDLRDSAALTSRWVSDISAPGSGAVKLVRSLARSPVLPTSSESPSSDSDSTGTTADSDTADTDTTNTTEVTLSRHHISRPLSEVTWTFSGLMRDPYFGSLGTMWLVNLVVAGALCIFWFVFCVMRACGTGGKNHATRYHSLCAARGYTITLLVLAGGMCTICAFAWTANVDLSRAIDDVYDSSDSVMSYYRAFSPLLTTLAETGDRATTLADSLATAVSALPAAPTSNATAPDPADDDAVAAAAVTAAAAVIADWGSCLQTATPALQQLEAVAHPLAATAVLSPSAATAAAALAVLTDTQDVESGGTARSFGHAPRAAEALALAHATRDTALPALAAAASAVSAAGAALETVPTSATTAADVAVVWEAANYYNALGAGAVYVTATAVSSASGSSLTAVESVPLALNSSSAASGKGATVTAHAAAVARGAVTADAALRATNTILASFTESSSSSSSVSTGVLSVAALQQYSDEINKAAADQDLDYLRTVTPLILAHLALLPAARGTRVAASAAAVAANNYTDPAGYLDLLEATVRPVARDVNTGLTGSDGLGAGTATDPVKETVTTTFFGAQLRAFKAVTVAASAALTAAISAATTAAPDYAAAASAASAARSAVAALRMLLASVTSTATATRSQLAMLSASLARIATASDYLTGTPAPDADTIENDILAAAAALSDAACFPAAYPAAASLHTLAAALPAPAASALTGGDYAARVAAASGISSLQATADAAGTEAVALASAVSTVLPLPSPAAADASDAAAAATAELAALDAAGFATLSAAETALTAAEDAASQALTIALAITQLVDTSPNSTVSVSSTLGASSQLFLLAASLQADLATATTAATAAENALAAAFAGITDYANGIAAPYSSVYERAPALAVAVSSTQTALALADAVFVSSGGFAASVVTAITTAVSQLSYPVGLLTVPSATALEAVAAGLATAVSQANATVTAIDSAKTSVQASYPSPVTLPYSSTSSGASASTAALEAVAAAGVAAGAKLTAFATAASAAEAAAVAVLDTGLLGATASSSASDTTPFPDCVDMYAFSDAAPLGTALTDLEAAAAPVFGAASSPGLKAFAVLADSNDYALAQADADPASLATSTPVTDAPADAAALEAESAADRAARLTDIRDAAAASASASAVKGAPLATVTRVQLAAYLDLAAAVPHALLARRQALSAGLLRSVAPRRDSVEKTYASYTDTREDIKDDADQWDGTRLLFMNVLVLMPFILAFIAAMSYFLEWPRLTMLAGHSLVACAILLFALSAVELPLAAVAADHCDVPVTHIQTALGDVTFKAADFPFLGLTSDVDVPAAISYLLECDGAAPAVVDALLAPAALLQAQGINASAIVTALSSVPTLTPTAAFAAQLKGITATEASAERALAAVGGQLDCALTQPLWIQARTAACDKLAPAVSLAVCMGMLLAMITVVAAVLTIQAYKRFNPKWRLGGAEVAPMDPYSAYDAKVTRGE